jgi:hypothetical protein
VSEGPGDGAALGRNVTDTSTGANVTDTACGDRVGASVLEKRTEKNVGECEGAAVGSSEGEGTGLPVGVVVGR